MDWLTNLNARLSRWALYIAVAGLLGIVGVVVGSVIWRYILNDAPAWSEFVSVLDRPVSHKPRLEKLFAEPSIFDE